MTEAQKKMVDLQRKALINTIKGRLHENPYYKLLLDSFQLGETQDTHKVYVILKDTPADKAGDVFEWLPGGSVYINLGVLYPNGFSCYAPKVVEYNSKWFCPLEEYEARDDFRGTQRIAAPEYVYAGGKEPVAIATREQEIEEEGKLDGYGDHLIHHDKFIES